MEKDYEKMDVGLFFLVAGSVYLYPHSAAAGVTVFFNTNQVATLVTSGTNSDTISSEGYEFTYTLDKLFTGGVGLTEPIGRSVRVPWPVGVEAQGITTGPQQGSAKMTIKRVDGALFSMPSLTFKLLANTAGAGATLEIMPILDGEDGLNDPVFFQASGYYGQQFSYNTASSPPHLGTTIALVNFEEYKITLYVDFALTALTLSSSVPNINHAPTDISASSVSVLENEPAGTVVGNFATNDPDPGNTFTYSLVAGTGGIDNGLFSINGSDLLTTVAFNYEVQSNYNIRVKSEDQGLLSHEKSFGIDVLDMNETPAFVDQNITAGNSMVLRWSSVTNHLYTVHVSTNLQTGFSVLESNISATPVMNTYTDAVQSLPARFWKITTEP